KNLGVVYRDGATPQLDPAYDIVGYAACNPAPGPPLHGSPPNPRPAARAGQPGGAKPGPPRGHLRAFCAVLGIRENPQPRALADCVKAAHARWPDLIAHAQLTPRQRQNLLDHFLSHPMVKSAQRAAARPRN